MSDQRIPALQNKTIVFNEYLVWFLSSFFCSQEFQESQAAELENVESELSHLIAQIEELEGQMSTLGLTLTQVRTEPCYCLLGRPY